jgi:hypothetical protein
MPILNYTTTISVEKSMSEVISALTRRGVTRVSTLFDDGAPAGIAFTMLTDYGVREFELPVKTAGVLRAMTADKKVARSQCTPQQAARVAWRIAKDWLEAQSALIDAELAKLDEVMLPYMVTNAKGDTVYSIIRAQGLKELEAAS